MARPTDSNEQLLCSFCGKSQRQVKKLIAGHSKQDIDKVKRDTERDYFMSSEEAKDYGIIDRVITSH